MTEKEIAIKFKDYTKEEIIVGLSHLGDPESAVYLIKCAVERKRRATFEAKLKELNDLSDRAHTAYLGYLILLSDKYGAGFRYADLTDDELINFAALDKEKRNANEELNRLEKEVN